MQAVVIYLPSELGEVFAKRMQRPESATMEKDLLNLIALGLEAERKSKPDHVRIGRKIANRKASRR